MAWGEIRESLRSQRLPAAFVDLKMFEKNIETVASWVLSKNENKKVRVATKSIRVPELIQKVLDFGSPFQGLMTYSAEETLYLAEKGFDDFLVAYPTLQKTDLLALRKVHEDLERKVRLIIDGSQNLQALAQAMEGVKEPFPFLIDVDASMQLFSGIVHLGVRRSPNRSVAAVLDLVEAAKGRPSVRFDGLMCYDAQVAGLGDRNPFKRWQNPVAGWVRRRSVKLLERRVRELTLALQAKGENYSVFNVGGTGSVNWVVDLEGPTEVTAGSAFLCPHLFDYYSNFRLEPAAGFALQVVRSSDPGIFTCQGGGYIASGEAGWDKVPRPWFPSGLELISTEGCGEVQTPIKVGSEVDLAVGDPVLFRHAKAGELAERFREYLLWDGEAFRRVPTYRGDGVSFF